MTDDIDFSPPAWLISSYHLIGIISMSLNTLGIYLLLWQNGKMGFFRWYLLSFQIFCTLLDIHLTFLMQPVPLYPLLAGYSIGVLATVFGVSIHYSLTIAMVVGFWELASLTICFAKKHQSIARILQKKRAAPIWLEALAYAGFIVVTLGVAIWPQYLVTSRQEQLEYVEKTYPQYLLQFRSLAYSVVYEPSFSMTLCMIVILMGGAGMFFAFLAFILDIFILMNELKTRISASTYQKHREAVESLIVQLATSIMCLGPPCIFVVVILAQVSHQQIISEILLCWFACHSSVNVTCLIIFFPPYRRFAMRIFKKDHRKRTVMVVSSVIRTSSNILTP